MVYLGFQIETPTLYDTSAGTHAVRNASTVWKITGAGTYTVKNLQAYLNTGVIRLAIYTSSGAFVMQGNATQTASGTAAWYGHTAFTNQAGQAITNPQLSGETNYILIVAFSAPSHNLYYTAGSAGNSCYISDDYLSGFPASISGVSCTSLNNVYALRCGVE